MTLPSYHSTHPSLGRAPTADAAHSTPSPFRELIESHLSLADRLARAYRNRGVEDEDLQQVARFALVKAAAGFDAEIGDFAPYAASTIRGELKRWFRDHAWDVRPPRRLQELQAALHADLADHPQDTDMRHAAERLGASYADVREAAVARGCFTADSVDDAEHGHRPLGADDDRFERVDQWLTFRRLCADLGHADRQLLHWRFVEEETQQRIADRLGISQMQVSRRLSALLARLRTAALDPAA